MQGRDGIRQSGQPIVAQMQLAQPDQARNGRRQLRQAVVGDPQLDQTDHPCYRVRQSIELVLADIEIAQALEPHERQGERREPVVVQVQEVTQPFDGAQTVRHPAKPVMAQVEHPQIFQIANTFGHFRQVVIRQDKRPQASLLPHLIRNDPQSLLPQRKMRSRETGHGRILRERRRQANMSGMGLHQGKSVAQRVVGLEAKAAFADEMGAAAHLDDHCLARSDRRRGPQDVAAEDSAGAAFE